MIRIPIFPLPNVVFFPKVSLPLHVFETRYRQMVRHALASDLPIAVVLLKPGWEQAYYGAPAIHPIATMTRILGHEELSDGRYNILLDGIERVRLQEESWGASDAAILYRRAWAISLPEKPITAAIEMAATHRRLERMAGELFREQSSRQMPTFPSDPPFEVLVNFLATYVDIPCDRKQALLEEDDLLLRGLALEKLLQERMFYWRSLRRFRNLMPSDPRLN